MILFVRQPGYSNGPDHLGTDPVRGAKPRAKKKIVRCSVIMEHF